MVIFFWIKCFLKFFSEKNWKNSKFWNIKLSNFYSDHIHEKSILSGPVVSDILKTAFFPRTPFNVAISHLSVFPMKTDIFAENLTMNQLFQKHTKKASVTFLVKWLHVFLKNDNKIIFHHIYHWFHLVGEVWPDLWTPAPHSMLTENKRFYT